MTEAAGHSPKLGDILVGRGIISQEQLEYALAEQRRTGRTLGAVLVEAGLAPGPIVAQALATQRGCMVKTEYGFATGFPTEEPPAAAGDSRDHEVDRLRRVIASRDAEIAQLRQIVDELRLSTVS